jgi:hypothetical protein
VGGYNALHLCHLVFPEADLVVAGKAVDEGSGPAQGDTSCTANRDTSEHSSTVLHGALASDSDERAKGVNADDVEPGKAGSLVIKQETPQTVLDGAFEGSPATLWGILTSEAERTDVAENDVGLIKATQRHGIRGNRARVSCLVPDYNDIS